MLNTFLISCAIATNMLHTHVVNLYPHAVNSNYAPQVLNQHLELIDYPTRNASLIDMNAKINR